MKRLEKRELIVNDNVIKRMVFDYNGSEVTKISNVWFKIKENRILDEYIEFDNKLYLKGYPASIDISNAKRIING